jgi:hypothetical protein
MREILWIRSNQCGMVHISLDHHLTDVSGLSKY